MSDISPWIARLAARSRDVRSEAVGWARYIKPPRRDRVAIVTDTSAALPDEVYMLATGPELFVVPIPVMIGEQIYDACDVALHMDLCIALASGWHIRTARASPGQLTACYMHVVEEGYSRVLSIHLSYKVPGTVEAARIAALSSPVPVTVID